MDLNLAILRTIIYFDCLDYPLTTFEIWKYLFWPGQMSVSLGAVLAELKRATGIEQKNGYYFLAGRETLVEERAARHRLSIAKMARARREARRLAILGDTHGVAVGNSLALRNSRASGDIDFLIITKACQTWQTRLITTAYSAFFDKRPRPGKKQDQNCLCFYLSEEAFNVSPWMLKPQAGWPDMYFIYWLATLLPLSGKNNIWEKFYEANKWLAEFLPNFFIANRSQTSALQAVSRANLAEWVAKNLQLLILSPTLRRRAHEDTAVILGDQVIKLHQIDGRERIRDLYLKKLYDHHLAI